MGSDCISSLSLLIFLLRSIFASVFAQSDAEKATKNKCSSTEQTHVHFVFKNIR